MAKITIIITDKEDHPHYSLREDKFEFKLESGNGIVDAHNVLIAMADEIYKKIDELKKEQVHKNAAYLLQEEKTDGMTEQERHEASQCYCFRTAKQTDKDCHYKDWVDGKLTDRDILGLYSY